MTNHTNYPDKALSDTAVSYETASGEIQFNMTNDYMFRAVLQKNNNVLRGLIGSLLHLSQDEIKEVIITNPIILGNTITAKEMWLDINVMLNGNTIINLEMQVVDLNNWHNRSVSYLCRSYDSLNRGGKYKDAKPVIHIGFLDYSIKGMIPEFYATYKLANVKNHQIYSDNLTLCVVDLNKTELAADEDKAYGIDIWAKLFKAKTWEAVKMLANDNTYISEASKTLFELCADYEVRKRCIEREEFEEYFHEFEDIKSALAHSKELLSESKAALAENQAALAESKAALTENQAALAESKAALAENQAALAESKAALAESKAALAEKDADIARLRKVLEWAQAHGYSEE